MFEAARLSDPIVHTQQLTGFLTGAAIGIALIAGAAFATFTCGLGVGLLAGIAAYGAASVTSILGEAVGSLFTNDAGRIGTCSHNVFINGLPAAFVTGPVACEEHGAESDSEVETAFKVDAGGQIAEGSRNVSINGRPAARVDDHTNCDGVIRQGSRNVFIGGGREAFLPIAKAIPDHYRQYVDFAYTAAGLIGGLARLAAGATVKAALPCAARFSSGYLAGDLFGRFLAAPVLQRIAGGLVGHPVDVTTGRKVLLADDETDFVLPGPIPYALNRFYASDLNEAGTLGRGWVLPWEVRLARRDGMIWYRDAQGRESGFPEPPPGYTVYHESERLFLACTHDGVFLLHDLNDTTNDFGTALSRGEDLAYLQRFGDGQGHWLSFKWSAGCCVAIDLPCDRLILHYHEDRLVRIDRQIDALTQTLVGYVYDDNDQLIEVTDTDNVCTRRFEYQNGLMVAHRNALGFKCIYRWDSVLGAPKVVEASTSSGQRWQYNYGAHYTRVTDDLGRFAEWHYDTEHQIIACRDLDGSHYRIEYSPAGHPLGLHLPGERLVQIRYDKLGRPVEVIDPLGRSTQTEYHRQSLRITALRLPDQAIYRASYDDLGRLLSTTDPLDREERYDYPSRSPWPSTHTDARGGQRHWAYNDRGQILTETDCSNKTTRYEYDVYGRFSGSTNALGETIRVTHHPGEKLLGLLHADGAAERYIYDDAGFLSTHIDRVGQAQHWLRDAEGRVVEHRNAAQVQVRYQYDPYGRLVSLSRGQANYRFRYDAADRLIHEIRPDGVERDLSYDECGNLTEIQWFGTGESLFQSFRYDLLGRILEQVAPTAITTYQYDAGDRLTLARRIPTPAGAASGLRSNAVSFRYDRAGRLLSEEGPNGRVGYEYGLVDELQRLELSRGSSQEWLHYGTGHVHQMRCGEHVIADIERDDLHREVQRTQGRLTHRQGYDASGRKLWQAAGFVPYLLGPGKGHNWRSYRYTQAGELDTQQDRLRGHVQYRYDASGQLLERSGPSTPTEKFSWDAAGNLLDGAHHGGYVQGNRLRVWQDLRFDYDPYGNLKTKRKGAHRIQHFEYDGEHRLVSVITEDRGRRTETRFDYDALGRRISREEVLLAAPGEPPRSRTRRFLWQGLRLVQEFDEEGSYQYLYSPDDPYTPMARIDSPAGNDSERRSPPRTWYFHTDAIGTPLELTDANGHLGWAGCYEAWGKVVGEDHRAPGLEQPLRFPGHYADKSTGLHYNTFRFYDPDIGRYINHDPIGIAGGDNLYAYAPNPTGWTDILGLTGCSLNPKTIHFMQKSIRNRTGDYTVLGNAEKLMQKSLSPSDLPTIRVWKDFEGKVWTLDHRRLAALRIANVDSVPVRWADRSEVAKEMWKMSTKTGGKSIVLKLENGNRLVVD